MSHEIKALLITLESELKISSLWRSEPPSVDALSSTMPFSCDTLSLPEWLQYIFIPRLSAMIEANAELPRNVSILPYAQIAFKDEKVNVSAILNVISSIDNTLSGGINA